MNAPTHQDYLNIIKSKLSGFTQFAEAFGKERFLVYKTEVHAAGESEENWALEDEEMEAIADAFRAEIKEENSSFSLFFYFDGHNPGHFLEIVDAGMPAPPAGGQNPPVALNPDGSTYTSRAPIQIWGEPVPEFSKPATGVINEIRTMLADLFREEIKEAIESSKKEILELVKTYTAERIHNVIGG